MYKYKSRCRWNILLYIDGTIKEIRPGEEFSYPSLIDSRFVVLQEPETIEPKKKKIGRPTKKKELSSLFLENSDGSSSTES